MNGKATFYVMKELIHFFLHLCSSLELWDSNSVNAICSIDSGMVIVKLGVCPSRMSGSKWKVLNGLNGRHLFSNFFNISILCDFRPTFTIENLSLVLRDLKGNTKSFVIPSSFLPFLLNLGYLMLPVASYLLFFFFKLSRAHKSS